MAELTCEAAQQAIVGLIEQYLRRRGLTQTASSLRDEAATLSVDNANMPFSQTDLTQLEAFMLEPLTKDYGRPLPKSNSLPITISGRTHDDGDSQMSQSPDVSHGTHDEEDLDEMNLSTSIETMSIGKSPVLPVRKERANTSMKIPTSLLLPLETLSERPDTWVNEDDPGYSRESVSEETLFYPSLSEADDSSDDDSYPNLSTIAPVDVKELINQKIAKLAEEFPGEMKRLHALLKHTTNEDDDTIDSVLLEHIELAKEGKLEEEENPRSEFASNQEEDGPTEFESFELKVIQVKNKTGFEETKDFPIVLSDTIAGRYLMEEYLGSAAFSRAVQCIDLEHPDKMRVCVKIITNNKDFFDQSMDEIKLLLHINAAGDPDEYHVLRMFDYFYHKEHLFIVSELLRDNLYEFYKYNRESGDELYFTIPRLRKIAKQVLQALQFIHSMNIIHCDLKPENILIKSYSRCEVKVIDFGSSCFTTDHLSSYVQSRSYRAPEVILGLPYDSKIDIWSLGCIIAELWTGKVLFLNESLQTLLTRVTSIIGPFPQHMLKRARHTHRYFTQSGQLYEKRSDGLCFLLNPKPCSLKHRLGSADMLFVDFVGRLLQVDPAMRPTATEALMHPFLREE